MGLKDKSKRKEWHHLYYLRNREKLMERSRRKYQEQKLDANYLQAKYEYNRKWCLDNKEHKKEVNVIWNKKNAEKRASYVRKHYAINKEACQIRHRAWMKQHPEKTRLYHFRRRVEKGCPPLSMEILNSVIKNNIDRYGKLTCIYCGPLNHKKMVIDHLFPISRGGNNNIKNLAISCFSCNAKKYNKTYDEFIGYVYPQGELQLPIQA